MTRNLRTDECICYTCGEIAKKSATELFKNTNGTTVRIHRKPKKYCRDLKSSLIAQGFITRLQHKHNFTRTRVIQLSLPLD